jgi:C-terminal processing protease CtpA/Prc
MIGRLRDDALDVYGVGTSPVWPGRVETANRDARLTLRLHEGGYGPSDHAPFYASGKPVLFVFTGNHADYHRPSDTADRVNAAGIEKVVGLLEPVVRSLARSSEPVGFVRVAADKEQPPGGARGFRVWVGSIPDYGDEGVGVRLTGVSPGSPAEKAGLQKGDVIVRFGPKQIRSIYDYTYALGEYKPGDSVSVVVTRDGREQSFELTLSARPSATR